MKILLCKVCYGLGLFIIVASAVLAAVEKFENSGRQDRPAVQNPAKVSGVSLRVESEAWCAPCQRLKPELDKVRAKGYSVSIVPKDDSTESIPRISFIRDGRVERVEVGFRTYDELLKSIRIVEAGVF